MERGIIYQGIDWNGYPATSLHVTFTDVKYNGSIVTCPYDTCPSASSCQRAIRFRGIDLNEAFERLREFPGPDESGKCEYYEYFDWCEWVNNG